MIEYAAQREEFVHAIKTNYEKVLSTERTLKIQVKRRRFSPEGIRKHCLMPSGEW